MPHHFRPYPPDQPLLLPPDLRDWLPEDHLVYTVSELVDALDLAAFYAPYAQQGSGNLPYAPAMMVKILVYGYATGVLSSRRLAQKLEEDVAFWVLVAVVQLARDLGLVSLATLVPDNTKVRANASKRKAMSYGRMQREEARLSSEIEKLQAAAEALDAAEDGQHGLDLRGDEVPCGPATPGKSAGRHPGGPSRPGGAGPQADTLAATPMETPAEPSVTPEPQTQYNFMDPESRIMKTSQDGFQQCYNAQIVADADSQLIVTTAVSAQARDQGQLPRLLEAVQARYGHTPTTLLADAGYRNERDLQELETRGIEGYVALGREGHTTCCGINPGGARFPRGPSLLRPRRHLAPPRGARATALCCPRTPTPGAFPL